MPALGSKYFTVIYSGHVVPMSVSVLYIFNQIPLINSIKTKPAVVDPLCGHKAANLGQVGCGRLPILRCKCSSVSILRDFLGVFELFEFLFRDFYEEFLRYLNLMATYAQR